MTKTHTKPLPNSRALRLQQEARNCIAIAVRAGEADEAALLIDEAEKLARRGRELSGGD